MQAPYRIVSGAVVEKSQANGFLFATSFDKVEGEFNDYYKAVDTFMGYGGEDDAAGVALITDTDAVIDYFNEDGDYCDGADG